MFFLNSFIEYCKPLTVPLLPETEFIAIYCYESANSNEVEPSLVDMIHVVPSKPPLQKQFKVNQRNWTLNADYVAPMNVVIFGIDGVSHMNFLRTMPLTVEFLIKEMKAEFLNGYTKVGENTFPNLVPVLTGLSVDELNTTCWKTKETYFDECPFIWKNYSEAGYNTAYSEDAVSMGIFNYVKKGFKKPPTDYFLNDFMYAASKLIGHQRKGNAILCYGPHLAFNILLDNLIKLSVRQGQSRPYFHFTWATSISHDYLNYPSMMDSDMRKTLKFLHENKYLNNTVFILMSDHGIRYGKIRKTPQGKTEENMPFLYAVFPNRFKAAFPSALTNFQKNQRKLTTPFDLHEMLKDLLNLSSIQDHRITTRQANLNSTRMSRGISLFLEIPKNRTCADASIPESFCVCHSMYSVPIDSEGAKDSALTAVEAINKMLAPYKQCSQLNLNSIISLQNVEFHGNKTDKNVKPLEYVVLFQTNPGDGLFEATAGSILSNDSAITSSQTRLWKIQNEISRVNAYGNQSHCVDDYNIKKYCYCY